MKEKFLKLVKESDNILITSHVSPDPDAVCSTLLLGLTLKKNFSGKKITMALEEGIADLSWLEGYNQVEIGQLEQISVASKPDLVIIVDAMNFERCTRLPVDKIKEIVAGSKLVIIDHHEQIGVERSDLYINRENPAATQEVYELLFNDLALSPPDGYAEISMLGIYSDTKGFIYANKNYKQTFDIVGDLLEQGVSIEQLYNRIHRYSKGQMKVLAELASNVSEDKDYTYTYISDSFFGGWPKDPEKATELKRACDVFLNEYIRNIEGRLWGFIVRKDLLDEGYYRVSFRAQTGTKNVSVIAKMFSGGGHKQAAGGKVQASSVEEAISRVKEAISKT